MCETFDEKDCLNAAIFEIVFDSTEAKASACAMQLSAENFSQTISSECTERMSVQNEKSLDMMTFP